MNFQDIVDSNKKQLEILKELDGFMISVSEAKKYIEGYNWWFFKYSFENTSANPHNTSIDIYTGLKDVLVNIDGYELKDVIRRVKGIYLNSQIDKFLNDIEKAYLNIVEIKREKDKGKKPSCYKEANINLDLLINSYNSLIEMFTYSNNINSDLNRYDEAQELEIRLLNENNNIEDLVKSLSLINSIYDNVNELIGDENEKLKFGRIESGSLIIYIAGCVSSLIAMKPILELAYKVYSDNFSPKAKLELEIKKLELTEKKIKVRGEYWKLIKEANEINGFKNIDEIEKKRILGNLANLESDISELYSLNPFIKIDDKEVGLKEMKDNIIPIKLLRESHIEEVIEELELN